jgi:DNA polymerase-2
VVPFARELVRRLRAGELDDELVYARRLRKVSLDRYTATTPPHVQAARKAGLSAGSVVRYVITASGPEPVLAGRPLPGPIDHRHYVERVVRPVAETILAPLGRDFDEVEGHPHQLSLI